MYDEPDPGALLVTGWPDDPSGFREIAMMAVECRELGIAYWVGRCQFDGNRPPLAYDYEGGAYPLTYVDADVQTESATAHGLPVPR